MMKTKAHLELKLVNEIKDNNKMTFLLILIPLSFSSFSMKAV